MGLFSRDKITLQLERYDYKPGDTIKGLVTLNLKKPTKARKMLVSLIGERKEPYRDSKGRTHYRVVEIFRFDLPLGGEKDYQNENFNFEIKVPNNILDSERPNIPDSDTTFGKIARAAIALSGTRYYPVEWLVRAQLDVPLKLDIKNSQKIIISQ